MLTIPAYRVAKSLVYTAFSVLKCDTTSKASVLEIDEYRWMKVGYISSLMEEVTHGATQAIRVEGRSVGLGRPWPNRVVIRIRGTTEIRNNLSRFARILLPTRGLTPPL